MSFGSTITDIGKALPIVGGVVSALGNIGADGRQIKQQAALIKQQEEAAMRLAANQQQLGLDTWNKTNIGAQKKHIEGAGMNAALMYGDSGATGSMQGISTPMPTGGQAATSAATSTATTQTGMAIAQMGLIAAQTKNIEADTAKKEAEAPNIEANTANTTQQTAIAKIREQLEGRSLEDQLDIIDNHERITRTQALVGENTAPQQIEIKQQELTNLAIEAVAKQTGIQLDNARINEISNNINQKWKELNITETKSRYEHDDRIRAIEEYTSTTLKAAGIQAAGNVIRDVVQIATRKIPTGSVSTTTNGTGEIIKETWRRPN